jgi:hypothetical protein
MEPYRKRRWRRASDATRIAFFTCARPGRSKSKDQPVSDKTVHQWVNNLPGPDTSIVSLLGDKPDGMSEFWFYSFYGGWDDPAEARGRLSFQAWLDKWHADRSIQVVEHPTHDYSPTKISAETLAAIETDVERLLAAGRTVILVDSGGETRAGQVCRHLKFVEDPRSQ